MGKFRDKLAKLITGVDVSKYRDKDKQPENGSMTLSGNPELNKEYLFDFRNYAADINNVVSFGVDNDIATPAGGVIMGSSVLMPREDGGSRDSVDIVSNSSGTKYPTKIKIKPIDVLCQLETIPEPFNLTLLDEKISVLRDKEKLITQVYAKREVVALIERLENRKKYNEHKQFFERFQNTDDEKIASLLSKYDLVMKPSDIFIPEFPDDAIKIMTEYTEKMKLICDRKPIFNVIAEEKDFKKAFGKRDPILLVQSPFGFYWQILGAWDAEMLLLSEL